MAVAGRIAAGIGVARAGDGTVAPTRLRPSQSRTSIVAPMFDQLNGLLGMDTVPTPSSGGATAAGTRVYEQLRDGLDCALARAIPRHVRRSAVTMLRPAAVHSSAASSLSSATSVMSREQDPPHPQVPATSGKTDSQAGSMGSFYDFVDTPNTFCGFPATHANRPVPAPHAPHVDALHVEEMDSPKMLSGEDLLNQTTSHNATPEMDRQQSLTVIARPVQPSLSRQTTACSLMDEDEYDLVQVTSIIHSEANGVPDALAEAAAFGVHTAGSARMDMPITPSRNHPSRYDDLADESERGLGTLPVTRYHRHRASHLGSMEYVRSPPATTLTNIPERVILPPMLPGEEMILALPRACVTSVESPEEQCCQTCMSSTKRGSDTPLTLLQRAVVDICSEADDDCTAAPASSVERPSEECCLITNHRIIVYTRTGLPVRVCVRHLSKFGLAFKLITSGLGSHPCHLQNGTSDAHGHTQTGSSYERNAAIRSSLSRLPPLQQAC